MIKLKTNQAKIDLLIAGLCVLFLVGSLIWFTRKSVYDRAIEKTVVITVSTKVTGIKLTTENGKTKTEQTEQLALVQGSGAFITNYGHVLTCAHLLTVGKIQAITVMDSSGDYRPGQILYADYLRDLCIISTEFKRSSHFELEKRVRVGEIVFAVGTPLGMPFSVSQGIISAVHRGDFMVDMTQTDAAINPGNSGGPLVNLDGELVGINAQILPPVNAPVFTGLGFAVSAEQIGEFLDRFKGLGNY